MAPARWAEPVSETDSAPPASGRGWTQLASGRDSTRPTFGRGLKPTVRPRRMPLSCAETEGLAPATAESSGLWLGRVVRKVVGSGRKVVDSGLRRLGGNGVNFPLQSFPRQSDWAGEEPPTSERHSRRAARRGREWSATSMPAARRKRRHLMTASGQVRCRWR